MRHVALLAVATVFCSHQAMAASKTTLKPEEITATFGNGKAFVSSTPSGTSYMLTLNADGTASRLPAKGMIPIPGKWRVSNDGYCSTWGSALETCYQVQKDGNRYVVVTARGSVAAYWSKQ